MSWKNMRPYTGAHDEMFPINLLGKCRKFKRVCPIPSEVRPGHAASQCDLYVNSEGAYRCPGGLWGCPGIQEPICHCRGVFRTTRVQSPRRGGIFRSVRFGGCTHARQGPKAGRATVVQGSQGFCAPHRRSELWRGCAYGRGNGDTPGRPRPTRGGIACFWRC